MWISAEARTLRTTPVARSAAAPTVGEPSRWPRCRKVRSSRSWLSRASRSTSHILFKRSPLEPTRSRRWRSTLRGSTSVAPCRRRSLTRILFAESCPGREAPADSPPHRACDRRDELRFSGRCSSRARGRPLPFPIVVRGSDGIAPAGVVGRRRGRLARPSGRARAEGALQGVRSIHVGTLQGVFQHAVNVWCPPLRPPPQTVRRTPRSYRGSSSDAPPRPRTHLRKDLFKEGDARGAPWSLLSPPGRHVISRGFGAP